MCNLEEKKVCQKRKSFSAKKYVAKVGEREQLQPIDFMIGQRMVSFVDAYSGYNQIQMNTSNQENTIFITYYGHTAIR